jgi:hypothetical protein
MSTQQLTSIKQGDRVVYAAAGQEFNAMALGAPAYGFNQGIRLSSLFLNLIYLNAQGTAVTITGAPLLAVAADDDHLNQVAEDAAKRDLAWKTADDYDKRVLIAQNLAHIKANPRTVGWRPFEDSEEVATLKATLEQTLMRHGQEIEDFKKLNAISAEVISGLNAKVAALEAERVAGTQEPAEIDPAAAAAAAAPGCGDQAAENSVHGQQ